VNNPVIKTERISFELLKQLKPHIKKVYDAQPVFDESPPLEVEKRDDLHLKPPQAVSEGGRYEGHWDTETNKREGLGV